MRLRAPTNTERQFGRVISRPVHTLRDPAMRMAGLVDRPVCEAERSL
jgi:hypothetical protein